MHTKEKRRKRQHFIDKGDDFMENGQFFSKEVQEYFDQLPKFYQESILQSGVNFQTKAEMKAFVEHLED